MREKTITQFLNEDYLEFAKYTIENRAIPSVIDGFKPSQRKVIHVCNNIWKTGNEKTLKVFQLAGKVASDAYYHHGNCLDYHTEIMLSNGDFIKIGDWLEKSPDVKLEVVCYDEDNDKFTKSIGHTPRIGKITKEQYSIGFDDDSQSPIECTSNHPFLTNRGWVNAEDLREGDYVFSINEREDGNKILKKIYSIDKNIYPEEKVFYDITVDIYQNFVVNRTSKVVVHNSSLENAIITMAQKFKNNAPLLEEDGQFGSLRSPQAGAPRYIGTKLSENFKFLYRDSDLLTHREEDGEIIEPNHFLPIIPTVLINGSSGIAVGFSSNILNRDTKEVIDSCIKTINGKKIKELKPHLNNFKGSFTQDTENNKKWYIRGVFDRVNTTTLRIRELPPSMTYEKYEEHLDKLLENKDIVSYEDNCRDDVDYTIKFTRSDLGGMTDDDLIKLLKLEETTTEIFTTLDQDGKLKIFDSTTEIIEYFVNFRLTYYEIRKNFLIDKIEKEIKVLSNRARFILAIIEGKIVVNNTPKATILANIENMGFDKVDDSYDYLLRMPIYSLTKELVEKLKTDLEIKKVELNKLIETKPQQMYLDDLSDIKKKFK